ncbi:hypothetical protein [Variovorax sp.]|uniref:hypothetical protein n=1 Tax=Variovorax sp. TaxID=1871043 RepID=UPI002D702616|nr:hypothetical protein [Variovorax sp.]HYP85211.1 hypothetical protein [Variovorax sp.]
MDAPGPWLAVAALGAVHGLNPATGWIFAAACAVRGGERSRAVLALLPIAAGHLLSVALVAGVVALAPWLGRQAQWLLQAGAGALLVATLLMHLRGGREVRNRPQGCGGRVRTVAPRSAAAVARHAGATSLALWSFIMATAHGAGLMLVPALVPLCLAGTPAREITASGSLGLVLAAIGLHMAAMLATTALMAGAACRLAGWCRRRLARLQAIAVAVADGRAAPRSRARSIWAATISAVAAERVQPR